MLYIVVEGSNSSFRVFAFVQGFVCLLIKAIKIYWSLGTKEGYAHADMYRRAVELMNMNPAYFIKYMLDMNLRIHFVADIEHIDGKFVAAQPHGNISLVDASSNGLGYRNQHLVAYHVTVCIIDGFKVVTVYQRQEALLIFL